MVGPGGFLLMYDGVDVDHWPSGVQYGLVYTDGRYANMAAARARFPGIQLQTISALGQVPADWVDCEPGCVWPVAQALSVYQAWRARGCRGIYCQQSVKAQVRQAAARLGLHPEIFGADWTNVPHINPDEAQTQFQNTPGYDVTAIPVPVAPAPPPGPAPIPQPVKAGGMRVVVAITPSTSPPQKQVTVGDHYLLFDNGQMYIIETPADVQSLIGALGPAVPLSGGFLGNIPQVP